LAPGGGGVQRGPTEIDPISFQEISSKKKYYIYIFLASLPGLWLLALAMQL
jgi:hypothetical protein